MDKLKWIPRELKELVSIYRENADNRGRRGEITTPPLPGSRKYPWGV